MDDRGLFHPEPRRPARRLVAAVLALGLVSAGAPRAEPGDAPRALGWLEWAWLEPGHARLKAKLDTGARTSSLHALAIERFARDGRDWVRFEVPLAPRSPRAGSTLRLERPLLREARIKTHGGGAVARPVVEIALCVGGLAFTTPVTLTDRSRFNYPLLLGRRALAGRAQVDAAQKFLHDDGCPPPAP